MVDIEEKEVANEDVLAEVEDRIFMTTEELMKLNGYVNEFIIMERDKKINDLRRSIITLKENYYKTKLEVVEKEAIILKMSIENEWKEETRNREKRRLFMEDIKNKYNLNSSSFGYDDETGEIFDNE